MRVIIVIPARLCSTRLPEKPLALLEGVPLVVHTYEAARRVPGVDRVIVAADDVRIVDTVRAFGGDAMITSTEHRSGTDRLAEVERHIDADVYVNLQCDEPLVRPNDIAMMLDAMRDNEAIACATLFHRIDEVEAARPSVVKVVVGAGGEALYFSRSPIPYPREGLFAEYRKHVGIYAYRRDLLKRYAGLSVPMEERAESLEQLRLLHAGVRMHAFEVERTGPGVDTPEDLENVRRILRSEAPIDDARGALERVRLVITDVDGVLTDGGLYYDATGESLKRFHVRDGVAVKLLHDAGIKVAAVSGRDSAAVRARLTELGFDTMLLGVDDKARACEELFSTFGCTGAEAIFLGDDLQDLPGFEVCGLSFAPFDAHARVRSRATTVLSACGGAGVLREVAELVCSARRS